MINQRRPSSIRREIDRKSVYGSFNPNWDSVSILLRRRLNNLSVIAHCGRWRIDSRSMTGVASSGIGECGGEAMGCD
ncbi:hypothetical protein TIFTF001_017279 [Ficus carica]|uniref:Uncharacterized protein n=1 Tax=Ficus carica TaxID=3494 RepID=A0AA88AAA8_FICCA|nr:hypothetical protein TIFTF001_017279 [Ficus carica]